MPEGSSSRPIAAPRSAWLVLALVAVVVVVYGGYGHHWSWTGINGQTATLWDWLHLLLLPLAAVVLPLWLRHQPRIGSGLKLALAAVGLVAVAIVIAGYTVPWAWTGFRGNSLWDWLNLGALPLAVVLIPVFVELRSRWGRAHAVLVGVAGAAFAVVVVAGYTIPWAWTGFTGNTLWDWLHLLLLPLLVPVAIAPIIKPLALARMGVENDSDAPAEPPEDEVPTESRVPQA